MTASSKLTALPEPPGVPVFRTAELACSATMPIDEIETTVAAGGSSLTYDPTTDQYIYFWKTDKAWTGQCRQLVVRLDDGSSHVANFKLRRATNPTCDVPV